MQLRPWFTQSLQKPLDDAESAIEAAMKIFMRIWEEEE